MFLRSMRPATILLPLALAAVGCAGTPRKSAPPPQTKAAAPQQRRADQRQIAYRMLSEVIRGVRTAPETYAYARSIIQTTDDADRWAQVFWGAGPVRGAAVEQIEFGCWLADHGADTRWLPQWVYWGDPMTNNRSLWDVMLNEYRQWVEESGMLGAWRWLHPNQVEVEEVVVSHGPDISTYFCIRLR